MDNGDISEPIFQMLSVNRWPCMHPLLIVQYVTTLKNVWHTKRTFEDIAKDCRRKVEKEVVLKKNIRKIPVLESLFKKLQSSRLQLY